MENNIFAAMLLLGGMFCFSLSATAQENLEQLIQGFDDDSPSQEQGDNPTKESLDKLLQGFEDDTTEQTTGQAEQALASKPPPKLKLTGYTSLSASYNYQHDRPDAGEVDYRGLSRLRYTVQPELQLSLANKWQGFASGLFSYDSAFSINDREQYSSEYLDEYESELELRELWLRGSLRGSWDVKLGRQIVVWGKSDSIRVVDVLNPLDMREPGMVDIEQLRLPVAMLRSDYYFGPWSLTAVIIPEIRSNKMPVPGSDFYPVSFEQPPDDAPQDWKDAELALALSGTFSGWDLSLHLASVYEDQPYYVGSGANMKRRYARLDMVGAAVTVVTGSWLFKSEVAYFDGVMFSALEDQPFSQLLGLLGVDYTGINDHTFTVEALWDHLFDYDPALKVLPDDRSENGGQIALRYTGDFWRDTLQLTAQLSLFGLEGEDGGIYRCSVKYIPRDAWSVSAGVIAYESGNAFLLKAFSRNDRVFAEVRYDF